MNEDGKQFARSEETRQKISQALKGKKKSPEHIQKILEAKKANPKPVSEETRKKISEAGKGRKLTEEHKRNLSKHMLGDSNPMKDPETVKVVHEKRKRYRFPSGPESKSYIRGYSITGAGYKLLTGYKGHPNAHKHNGRILEHVLVMSTHLGRPLTEYETVHHKNGVRDDNRLENLELWSSHHPPGQRVEDKVAYAVEILKLYSPDLLAA